MFSQKRRQNWPLIILLIIVAITFAAAAIIVTKNYVDRNASQYVNDMQTNTDIPYKDYSEENDEYDDNESEENDDYEYDSENNEKNHFEEKNDESDAPYFTVKESNNIIKVFFNKNGNEKFLQDTDIIFDMLSEEDQKRFRDGITVNTEEELNRLIMDYES